MTQAVERHQSIVVVACFWASLVAGIGAQVFLSGEDLYLPLAFCVGALLVSLLASEWRRVGHPLSPAGVMLGGAVLVFFLRPLTISSAGTTTAGAALDAQTFTGAIVEAGNQALFQVLVFFGAFGIVLLTRTRRTLPVEAGPDVPVTRHQVNRAATILVLAMCFSGAVAAYLVSSSGGLQAFVSGLSIRSSFLSGKFFLTLGYVPLVAALVYYLLARQGLSARRTWNWLAWLATLVLVFSAFTSAGRGPLILGVCLPLLIVKQSGPRPLKNVTIASIAVVTIVAAMLMSLVLRENTYTGGAALNDLRADPVTALLTRLTSGAETRPFDSLVLLNQNALEGDVPTMMGSTYASAPTWFLPGSLGIEKGGANTWFTSTYIPRFYYPHKIETSISAIGEAYANFRWVGVVVVGGLLGVAVVSFTRRGRRTIVSLALTALITPIFFSFIRSDLYQNLPLILLFIGLTMGIHAVARPAVRASGDPAAHHPVRTSRHATARSRRPSTGGSSNVGQRR